MSDVPEGYKMSEVGVIPEEWDVMTLGVIADVKTGPFGSSLHERDYVNDGTPIITVEHLGEQGVVHKNLPMVSDFDRKRLNAYALQPDDIVFSRVGSVDRNSLIKEKENGWLFSGRLLRIRLNTKFIVSTYLSYYLHQEPTKQRIRSVAVGQTMASLNTEILKNIEVAFPPTKEEQQAIASALSDVDALIAALEQLITKKRNIKQGAMQQLLTGEKRLPGFGGAWGLRKLGDVSEIIMGQSPAGNSYNQNAIGIPLINGPTEFTEKYPIKIQWTSLPTKLCKEGDILLCIRGSSTGRMNISNDGYCIGRGIAAIRSKENSDGSFLEFQVQNAVKNILALTTGSTFPNIDGKSLKNIEVLHPPLLEQQAIAKILSNMDAEIEALKQKQSKYKTIKQGMMQDLLTGKTRLI